MTRFVRPPHQIIGLGGRLPEEDINHSPTVLISGLAHPHPDHRHGVSAEASGRAVRAGAEAPRWSRSRLSLRTRLRTYPCDRAHRTWLAGRVTETVTLSPTRSHSFSGPWAIWAFNPASTRVGEGSSGVKVAPPSDVNPGWNPGSLPRVQPGLGKGIDRSSDEAVGSIGPTGRTCGAGRTDVRTGRPGTGRDGLGGRARQG